MSLTLLRKEERAAAIDDDEEEEEEEVSRAREGPQPFATCIDLNVISFRVRVPVLSVNK